MQLGSSSLTLGFSTDPTPQSLPHTIAYRHTGHTSGGDITLQLKHPSTITQELELRRESVVGSIQESLLYWRRVGGIRETGVNREEYREHNSRVQPVARESEELSLTDISSQLNFVIGNEVLYLPPGSNYRAYKPIRKGQLNCSAMSRSAVLSMLEDLWTRAVEDCLAIDKKDFKNYRVVLLVSDIVDRCLFKDLMDILLLRMEFAAAFLHQESVCAAYCAGLASCCVVNVGDELTQISCVEEGISNPNTRLVLQYGGSDITRLFYSLITKTNFPYVKCSPESRLDGVLIQHLKESVCNLDASIWGVRDYQFTVMSSVPGCLLDYEMKLSDEGIMAAMGVFFPSSFCLSPTAQLMRGQDTQAPNREDLFDELQEPAIKPTSGVDHGTIVSLEEQVDELFYSLDTMTVDQGLPEATRRLKAVQNGNVLPIDQAIHLSINCAGSRESKNKLYGSILLVGGGLAFPGSSKALHHRLLHNSPSLISIAGDAVEVHSNVRELESSQVAWKGGAVLSCLDTSHELWIERQEWEFSGVRLLRERAPFLW